MYVNLIDGGSKRYKSIKEAWDPIKFIVMHVNLGKEWFGEESVDKEDD